MEKMQKLHQGASDLLRKCQSQLAFRNPEPRQSSAVAKLRRKLGAVVSGKMSPQQQQDNDKIIAKLRRNYHRKSRESSIKKTELGEDLLTFTPEEYQQLQLIDHCLEKGLPLPTQLTTCEQPQVLSAVERLKRMGRLEDTAQEIKSHLEWGTGGSSNKCSPKAKKEHSGFQKRKPKGLLNVKGSNESGKSEENSYRGSLNRYFQTLLNKASFGRQFLNSSTAWGGKPAVAVSFAQKLEQVRQQAGKRVERLCEANSIFMTQQRKAALYECQVLRLSKKLLNSNDYQRLHFSVSQKPPTSCDDPRERESPRESEDKDCQAAEILQKNYNRIKAQRKRVIEKLLC